MSYILAGTYKRLAPFAIEAQAAKFQHSFLGPRSPHFTANGIRYEEPAGSISTIILGHFFYPAPPASWTLYLSIKRPQQKIKAAICTFQPRSRPLLPLVDRVGICKLLKPATKYPSVGEAKKKQFFFGKLKQKRSADLVEITTFHRNSSSSNNNNSSSSTSSSTSSSRSTTINKHRT